MYLPIIIVIDLFYFYIGTYTKVYLFKKNKYESQTYNINEQI